MIDKNICLGVVSSGGGLRTYYNAGLFYQLKKHGYNVCHITAASGGATAGALPYLAAENEEEIEQYMKDLAKQQTVFTFRKNMFTPSFFNMSGGYVLEMNRRFLQEQFEFFAKKHVFYENLKKIRLDISVTDITDKVQNEMIHFNPIVLEEKDEEKVLDVLQATTCTIPLSKAPKINGKYYIDGGYTKNSPMKNLFMNPDVKEMILIDFTHYQKYDDTIDKCYQPNPIRFMDNFIEMQELSMQISFDACNKTQLESALFLNNLISETKKQVLTVNKKSYVYKKIHALEPKDLEMNPLHPKADQLAWEYYLLGKAEAEKLLLE